MGRKNKEKNYNKKRLKTHSFMIQLKNRTANYLKIQKK